jgi:hypothetical protein
MACPADLLEDLRCFVSVNASFESSKKRVIASMVRSLFDVQALVWDGLDGVVVGGGRVEWGVC